MENLEQNKVFHICGRREIWQTLFCARFSIGFPFLLQEWETYVKPGAEQGFPFPGAPRLNPATNIWVPTSSCGNLFSATGIRRAASPLLGFLADGLASWPASERASQPASQPTDPCSWRASGFDGWQNSAPVGRAAGGPSGRTAGWLAGGRRAGRKAARVSHAVANMLTALIHACRQADSRFG